MTKAAVVARRDDFLDQVVVAFVTKAPDVADDAALIDRVMDRCIGDLSKFKVPRAVYIIDEIPMGGTRKGSQEPSAGDGRSVAPAMSRAIACPVAEWTACCSASYAVGGRVIANSC